VALSILSRNPAFGEPCDWVRPIDQTRIIMICYSTKIDSVFLGRDSKPFPNLTYFEIYSSLTVIDEEQFIKAVNLQTLDLCCNKIQQVHENAFIGLHSLTVLKLSSNKIQSIPMNVFADLLKLNDLRLHENLLTSFDFSIVKHNHQLEQLTINKNAITHVTFDSESVKVKIPKLKKLNFRDNKFDCCSLLDIVNTMVLVMPNLTMDLSFIENYNNSTTIQYETKCIACDRPIYNQRKIGDLKAIIRRMEEKNQNQEEKNQNQEEKNQNQEEKYNKLFNIGLAIAIGVVFVVFVLMMVGVSCLCHLKKLMKQQPKVEISCKDHTQPIEEEVYMEMPSKDQTESFYETM
jgi:Leucine rich repeat